MSNRKWAIIYDDLSVLTSDDFSPEQVRLDGVQWIVEIPTEGGRRYVHGMDYYRWTGDSWAGGNLNDLEKWLRLRELQIIIFGLWISDEQYAQVKALAEKLLK